jgi:MFS superfamily sulfate permease-like transporter
MMKFKEYFSHDFFASIVVFLVALPLCLGIALASGAPLHAGLLTGVIGGLVVGFLSGSPISVSGPAAGLTTIVLSSIGKLGSYEAFLLAVFLAGIFQIILGFLKAGTIGHFVPVAVIKGMLAAIGLILILKQIPHAVGYDSDFEGDESFFQPDGRNTFTEIIESLGAFSEGAIIISVTSMALMWLWGQPWIQKRNILPLLPGALIAVLAGVLLNLLFIQYAPSLALGDKHLVGMPNFLADNGSGLFMFPDFSRWRDPTIYATALTITIVASLESLLSIEACDKLDPYRRITPLNRELRAQGVGNSLAGLLGGLPLTAVIVRSSANAGAGARTKASTITHGLILLLSILFIPHVLRLIPLSCLAGVLIVIGYKLTPPSLYKEIYMRGKDQFLPFIITVVAIVFTNLLQGVFIGLLVAVFFILRTNFREAILFVSDGNNYLLKLKHDVSFLNKSTLKHKFTMIPDNASVLIDGSGANFVDHDVKEIIRDFIEASKAKQITVQLKHLIV